MRKAEFETRRSMAFLPSKPRLDRDSVKGKDPQRLLGVVDGFARETDRVDPPDCERSVIYDRAGRFFGCRALERISSNGDILWSRP